MTMTKFRAAPRNGYMRRLQRIAGYSAKMRHGAIRFRTELPNLSSLENVEYGWEKIIYRKVTEVIPTDALKPLGKLIKMIAYVNVNLMHDIVTGRSVTGIIHLLNQTPVEWFTKRQPIKEMTSYGAKFMAARTATRQILEMRTTMRYLGVQVNGPTFLFGYNKTVVESCNILKAKLHKRHVILSFY